MPFSVYSPMSVWTVASSLPVAVPTVKIWEPEAGTGPGFAAAVAGLGVVAAAGLAGAGPAEAARPGAALGLGAPYLPAAGAEVADGAALPFEEYDDPPARPAAPHVVEAAAALPSPLPPVGLHDGAALPPPLPAATFPDCDLESVLPLPIGAATLPLPPEAPELNEAPFPTALPPIALPPPPL
mmetsp:Transcript_91948/g.265282  ORF Transcript_91948/g.265282 Transcript_91948/m.265282 type:complete len:183 (-) Transcript_91948:105-653(-)